MSPKIITCIVLFASISFAAHPIDSVVVSVSSQKDTTQINNLLDKAWNLRSNQPLKAIQFAREALTISNSAGNVVTEAKANNFLGIIYTNIGAIEIALDYHFAARELAAEVKATEQLAYSFNNIGGIYRIKNNFSLAGENIQSAVNLFLELKNKQGLAYCYINLGRLYAAQDDFTKSLEYFENALAIADDLKNGDMRARILLEKANLLLQQEKYKDAEDTFIALEKLYTDINYQKGLAEVWSGLSELFMKEKLFRKALDFATKALMKNREIFNLEGEVSNQNNIALIYLELGSPETSKQYLKSALESSLKSKESALLLNTYETNYKFYKKSGDSKQALIFYEKLHNLKDSLYSKKEMIRFGELESILKLERSEQENQILQQDLRNQTAQRNYLIVIAVLMLIIGLILLYMFYEKKKISDELRHSNAIKDKFFRIIAHDLREPFNALFSAVELLKENYSELSEDERRDTIDIISKAIKTDFDLLENLLLWARNQSNDLRFEPIRLNLKSVLERNLSLSKSSFDRKKISYELACPDNLNVNADDQMINSIFRNLIFNAIKFTSENGKVSVSGTVEGNNAVIIISDTGLGMNSETLSNLFRLDKKVIIPGTAGEPGSGIGLILTKEFITRHGGTISVTSEEGKGSKFRVTLPID